MKIRRVCLYCGARFFRRSDWKLYPLFTKVPFARGFSIGPVLFWDGS